jgi:hypothetical protein
MTKMEMTDDIHAYFSDDPLQKITVEQQTRIRGYLKALSVLPRGRRWV